MTIYDLCFHAYDFDDTAEYFIIFDDGVLSIIAEDMAIEILDLEIQWFSCKDDENKIIVKVEGSGYAVFKK